MKSVLAFDPSGNMSERDGQGTSGWAYFKDGTLEDFGAIESRNFDTIEGYWAQHVYIISVLKPDIVVCESYKLQPTKAMAQSWSNLETSQLIGYMRMTCWRVGTPFIFQDPAVKARVTDPILTHLGVLQRKGNRYFCLDRQTNLHQRDAIRHGIYFHKYNKEGAK